LGKMLKKCQIWFVPNQKVFAYVAQNFELLEVGRPKLFCRWSLKNCPQGKFHEDILNKTGEWGTQAKLVPMYKCDVACTNVHREGLYIVFSCHGFDTTDSPRCVHTTIILHFACA
jgi:hypothetical protein